jgi:hypothetical protein
MSEKAKNRDEAVPTWRALALLTRGTWTEAADGFGGPEVAGTVGTPDEIGKELTRFLDGLERKNVEMERFHTGRRGRPPIDSQGWPVNRAGAGAAGALLLARVGPRRPQGMRTRQTAKHHDRQPPTAKNWPCLCKPRWRCRSTAAAAARPRRLSCEGASAAAGHAEVRGFTRAGFPA